MYTTLTVIKAQVGNIGGHVAPSRALIETIDKRLQSAKKGLLSDCALAVLGGDVALLMVHDHGINDREIHLLGWETLLAGAETARSQGLCGAGRDLVGDTFHGTIRGLGPCVAEMEIEERASEPFLMFLTDRTGPGVFNLPLYLSFADPMHTPGLLLSLCLAKGFRFRVLDRASSDGDRLVDLTPPEDLYDLAALLQDGERYVIESISSRHSGEHAVAVSTKRTPPAGSPPTPRGDPVMLVRVESNFPTTGEVLSPFSTAPFVGGTLRSHLVGPLMPVTHGMACSYCDGPPMVSCHGFCLKNRRLTEALDLFAPSFWEAVRLRAAEKAMELRRQGFAGGALFPSSERGPGGLAAILERLDSRFTVRSPSRSARGRS